VNIKRVDAPADLQTNPSFAPQASPVGKGPKDIAFGEEWK